MRTKMRYGLDAMSSNTVQLWPVVKTVLTISGPLKDEIFPDELSNCKCIRMAVFRRIV
jgi:hypothetical protein